MDIRKANEEQYLQSLDAADLMARSVRKGERKRYLDRLNLKERGDITICESYVVQCMRAQQEGKNPLDVVGQQKISFIIEQMKKHPRYFSKDALGFLSI